MVKLTVKANTHALIIGLSIVAWSAAACDPEFEDESKALLKKPELLSIVMTPPEAAPGEKVKVSFLTGDQKGVLDPELNLWLPLDMMDAVSGGKDSASLIQQELEKMELEQPQLTGKELTFTVKSKDEYTFNKEGLALQPISLLVQTGKLPQTIQTPEQLLANLPELMNTRAVKLASRTLLVSTRAQKNTNPEVASISGVVYNKRDTDKKIPLTIARHNAADLSAARQAAADNPWIVESDTEVMFSATRPAGEVPEEEIRYQWISTGGDFNGRREREERWEAPAYKKPQKGEIDQTGKTRVNPRTDPNLYPVWLILRDNGGDNRLGQSWFELYIRIVPKKDK